MSGFINIRCRCALHRGVVVDSVREVIFSNKIHQTTEYPMLKPIIAYIVIRLSDECCAVNVLDLSLALY